MAVSTFYACPCCFLSSILVICVRALVLLDGDVSKFSVIDLVLCAGAVVFIKVLFLFSLCCCLDTVDCSTFRTTGADIFDMGCIIYLV